MGQVSKRKKWIGLALLIALCLSGVYRAGNTADIPVYTSFSQSFAGWRLCPGDIVRLPDAAPSSERLRPLGTEQLGRERPWTRSCKAPVNLDCGMEAGYWQCIVNCRWREKTEGAVCPCRYRIIRYIHDQDGLKGSIL